MFLRLFALVAVLAVAAEASISFEQDITLKRKESQALQKFKTRMMPKLEYDYQKSDIYLLRYLRAKTFDVNKAEEYLTSEMRWRKANNMETIHSENWDDMKKEATMRVEGNDRAGRPLIIWELGDWDLRKFAVAGKIDRAVRWTLKNWDEAQLKVRELEQAGKNITRWTMVLDLRNINAVTNVNPASMPYYVGASLGYDGHFPGMGDNIFLLNTPGLFETVLTLVRPGLSDETRANLKVYSKNFDEWNKIVFDAVDPAMLPSRYGGTKPDDN